MHTPILFNHFLPLKLKSIIGNPLSLKKNLMFSSHVFPAQLSHPFPHLTIFTISAITRDKVDRGQRGLLAALGPGS